MARFDIYRSLARSSTAIPFLIDVQNNRLSALRTRIVIPLRTIDPLSVFALNAAADLFPRLHVAGADHFLATTELGAIEVTKLGPFVISGSRIRMQSKRHWIASLDRTDRRLGDFCFAVRT